jgi:dTDP-4-dehydrorhamnose reductase
VFLSSDGIFDGSRAYWSEADEPRPILTYGRQKVEVERFVATLPGPWLIARLPKLLSTQPDPRCMLTQWIGALETGGRIICATDQFFTPAATTDAAQALAALVRGGAQGLYHLGGPERLSRRKLLQAVLDEYGKSSVPKAEITYCSLREIQVKEPRPLDTSLSSERFASRYANPMRAASEVARLIVRNHCAP